MPAPLSVLVVHSSAELYGSDKSLLDFARLRPAHMALTVVLPEDDPLVPARKLVRWLSQTAICNSNQTRAWIVDGNGDGDPRRAARCLALWNGVDVATQTVDREAARRSLGAAPGEVLFMLLGRINVWKDQQLLVQAFAAMVRQGVAGQGSLRLAIVGSAFAGQQHWLQQLQAAVAASGCAEQIVVQPFRSDVEAVWAAADVVVPSTDPERFGRVAVEAMAFARPATAAAHGGLFEIVQPGVTGLPVPPRDMPALTNAMAALAADPSLRAAMDQAGLARQRAVFSVQGYADRVGAVLDAAAAAPQVRA